MAERRSDGSRAGSDMSEQQVALADALRPARSRRSRDQGAAWFLGPFLLAYLLLMVLPVLQALYMGLHDWDLLVQDNRSFVGLRNYGRMFWGSEMTWDATHLRGLRLAGLAMLLPLLSAVRRGTLQRRPAVVLAGVIVLMFGGLLGLHPGPGGRWYDAMFWRSFGNTLQFVALSSPLIIGLGLGLALALNGAGRLTAVLRTMFFAPYVLSVAVVTLIWAFLLSPSLGLIGAAMSAWGQDPVNWLGSTTWAMPAIVVTTMWWTVGFNLVIFLAGLQDIDPVQYEAAAIDGAGAWQRFRFVTVPGLRRTFLLVGVLQVVASFQVFGQVFIMTRGGPSGATRVSIQHIFETGFRDYQLGYASAMSTFLFLVMAAISAVQFFLLRDRDTA